MWELCLFRLAANASRFVQPEHELQQSNPGKSTLGLASKPATIVI